MKAPLQLSGFAAQRVAREPCLVRTRHTIAVMGLAFIPAGCQCDVAFFRLDPSIHGTLTIIRASGDQEVLQIVDASDLTTGDVVDCSLGYEVTYRDFLPEAEASVPLNMGCDDEFGLGGLVFGLDNSLETFELLDLNAASVGESRRIPATLWGKWVEATLVVTRVEGEYRAAPDGPTDDYLREFTLTAVYDCAAAADGACDYRMEVSLEGRQTAADFSGACGATPDE